MSIPDEYAETAWQPSAPHQPRQRPSGVRLGSLPGNSQQDLRFVQDRLALLGKTTFLISSMFLVATLSADTIRGISRMLPLGRASHIAGTIIALLVWRILKAERTLSPHALQCFDVSGTLGIGVSFALMGHYSLQPYGFYTGMLAMTHVSICRAMIVPSVPKRTLFIAAASFAGFVVSRSLLPLPEGGARAREVLEALLWSTAGASVATMASKVIYGLHEKAREARQLGQYTLEEKIGEGGMGEIFRASHAMLRRPTAVKLISGQSSEQQLHRFEKEVQLTARLTHPNTISIYDYGRTPEGVFYYAMELLDGLSLEQLVHGYGPQPAARVIHVLLQVCGALREAHGVGLIHRDIKPANIYLCRRGDIPDTVKVLDFGLVREMKADGDVTQSNVNALVGTPLYLAPEAILSPDKLDARADIYGLGGVAYFLSTGVTPFTGHSLVEICGHHLHTEPPPPSQRNPVPDDLERVILACLEKDPAARPQSARAVALLLESCRDAGGWKEADAEAWWARWTEDGSGGRANVRAAADTSRMTAFQVDLDQRLRVERTG